MLRGIMADVQRFTLELLSRFGQRLQRISPPQKLDILKGDIWEQQLES